MNIGEAAKESGVNAKMIRHYESVGLLPKPRRSDAGYRVYSSNDVNTFRFIRRARDLGFPIKEIKKLLGLWRNQKRESAEVKKLAMEHVGKLDEKIRELQEMRGVLEALVKSCSGDHRPDCPILDNFAQINKKCH